MDTEQMFVWKSEADLLGAALALDAASVAGWSAAETTALDELGPLAAPSRADLARLRRAIKDGHDPLGEGITRLRTPEMRRPIGATYTPPEIVESMIAWAADSDAPDRVIDPGLGSGRFAVAAGRRFPKAKIVGVELDPVAAILGRATLAAAGLGDRATVVLNDYRAFRAEPFDGRTLYVGNPPYVRHHQIDAKWKAWLVQTARARDLGASQLAGLHVYFFLATAAHAQAGDVGAFITSAEWLDVNYGSLVRELLLDGLGGTSIHVVEPTARPFEDAATTAAITCFQIGSRPRSIKLRRVKTTSRLGKLDQGQPIRRERLIEARRWTPFTRAAREMPEGFVELGELCRVHRGSVTGANSVWIVDPTFEQLPAEALFASVTRARELFAAKTELIDTSALRRVVDLPADLDVFDSDVRKQVERFLRKAKRNGAHRGYVAMHRKAWWSVGLREPAPILATYMARRPPVFVRNLGNARHINIAHGLYPRQKMSQSALDRIAAYLRDSVTLDLGRTYAGGLTKFEPREMERLPVPVLSS